MNVIFFSTTITDALTFKKIGGSSELGSIFLRSQKDPCDIVADTRSGRHWLFRNTGSRPPCCGKPTHGLRETCGHRSEGQVQPVTRHPNNPLLGVGLRTTADATWFGIHTRLTNTCDDQVYSTVIVFWAGTLKFCEPHTFQDWFKWNSVLTITIQRKAHQPISNVIA